MKPIQRHRIHMLINSADLDNQFLAVEEIEKGQDEIAKAFVRYLRKIGNSEICSTKQTHILTNVMNFFFNGYSGKSYHRNLWRAKQFLYSVFGIEWNYDDTIWCPIFDPVLPKYTPETIYEMIKDRLDGNTDLIR